MSQVIDVTLANFEQVVIEGSMEKPVVVDFWASWCAPCKALGPILEKLSTEFGFVLAKIDTETPENQQLAAYLRVSSIPDIRVFKSGQMVDALQGALPEAQLRKRLSKYFLSEEDLQILQVETALEQGQAAEALDGLGVLLRQKPEDRKLRYLQAKCLVALGQGEDATRLLRTFLESDDYYREARALLELMDFHTEAARTDVADAETMEYRTACRHAANGDYRAAFETFLAQVVRDPSAKDSPARKAMLTLFGVLGPKHELTWEYRAKLNTLVFI